MESVLVREAAQKLKIPFHARSVGDILKELITDEKTGLSLEEVAHRKILYGKNTLPKGKKTSAIKLFLAQFKSPLVWILVFAAIVTYILREFIDFSVISVAVLVNVIVGFWQEYRSNKIFEKMEHLVEVTARVLRGGELYNVDAEDLVPGDIILLHSDTKVPGDARIISARDLYVNEAALTGESAPVEKDEEVYEESAVVAERKNMLFMGTLIERGEGRAVIVGTGGKTEIGKIAALTLSTEDEKTPLQERLASLGRKIAIGISIIALLIFIVGMFEGHSFAEMFTVAAAVSVAAIPEGLPAALSVVLAVAATKVLKQRGLVKKLLAAETLGSTSVIVTDKTGTLTTGEMKVEEIICAEDISRASLAMALSSDIVVTKGKEGIHFQGEATDKAKVLFFINAGGDLEKAKSEYPLCSFIPFDQVKKYIASFHKKKDGTGHLFVSGAPERLAHLSTLSEEKRGEVISQVELYAKRGYRMIGIAEKEILDAKTLHCDDNKSLLAHAHKLIFLGVAAIRDPIREDVRESLITTRKAGVRVIMATGDHKLTAHAIGIELGFSPDEDAICDGPEIDKLSKEALKERLAKVEIFSRVSPEHKMRVIEAFREMGEVVAMTGDGVNDAPALRAADIGVVLSSGTDIAKETGDLILLDNSFTVITESIRQGRVAFDNMRKVTVFLLSNSFTEIIIILAGLFLKTAFLPITAVQILWANLVEDTLPNIALAFEHGEKDVMERKPIAKKESIIDREGLAIIFLVGILSDLFLVAVFLYLVFFTALPPHHIQTFIFAILGTNSLFIVFAVKSYRSSIFQTRLFDNPYLVIAFIVGLLLMGAAIYFPPLQRLLATQPLTFPEISFVLGVCFAQATAIEVVKWAFRRRK